MDILNQNSMKKLRSKVAAALKREFNYEYTISSRMNRLVLKIRNVDFEQHLGKLLQQVQQIIDRYYPQRQEHILLTIKAMDGANENTFKIWKSV